MQSATRTIIRNAVAPIERELECVQQQAGPGNGDKRTNSATSTQQKTNEAKALSGGFDGAIKSDGTNPF